MESAQHDQELEDMEESVQRCRLFSDLLRIIRRATTRSSRIFSDLCREWQCRGRRKRKIETPPRAASPVPAMRCEFLERTRPNNVVQTAALETS